MMQMSVPWSPGGKIEYRGLAGLIAGLAKVIRHLIGPIIRATLGWNLVAGVI